LTVKFEKIDTSKMIEGAIVVLVGMQIGNDRIRQADWQQI
jgi:hypothetical protein